MTKASTISSSTVPAPSCILVVAAVCIILRTSGLCSILINIECTNIMFRSTTTSSLSIGYMSASIDVQTMMCDVRMSSIQAKSSPFIVCKRTSRIGNIDDIDFSLCTLSSTLITLVASSFVSTYSGTTTISTSNAAASTVSTKVWDAAFAVIALIFQLRAAVESSHFLWVRSGSSSQIMRVLQTNHSFLRLEFHILSFGSL